MFESSKHDVDTKVGKRYTCQERFAMKGELHSQCDASHPLSPSPFSPYDPIHCSFIHSSDTQLQVNCPTSVPHNPANKNGQ